MMHFNPSASLRTLAAIILISIIGVIGGCATKFIPTTQMVNRSNSIKFEEAIKILNDNIYLPYRITEKVTVFPGVSYVVGGYDIKTTVRATPKGILFENLFEKGKEISRSAGKINYEIDRYDLELPYQKIEYILEAGDRATKHFCYVNDYVIGFQFSDSDYFILCVNNKEDAYSSILKLFPTAEFQTLN